MNERGGAHTHEHILTHLFVMQIRLFTVYGREELSPLRQSIGVSGHQTLSPEEVT